MAIYSVSVSSIGRSTHAAGTAGAHIRYIARPGAAPSIVAQNMPANPNEARSWLNANEQDDRKNARVVDRIRIALPRELDEQQRMDLLQSFCRDVTGDRVPFYAAIHQDGKDAHNPHAHVVIRDRDIETGKRVLRWSDSKRDREKAGLMPSPVDHIRQRWEVLANAALERAGHDARIDRRSLEDQGIDRVPTIHIGPNAKTIENQIHRPTSQNRLETVWWRDYRDEIPYEAIDAGRTRQERNAEIIDLNLEKAIRSPDFATRERAKLQRELKAQETVLERRLITEARQQTYAERQTRTHYRQGWQEAKRTANAEETATRFHLAKQWRHDRSALKALHDGQKAELAAKQGRFTARFMRAIDITGRTREKDAADKRAQIDQQAAAREQLVSKHRKGKEALLGAVVARHAPILIAIRTEHQSAQMALQDRFEPATVEADRLRQEQARIRAEREARLDQGLKQIEQMQRRAAKERGPKIR